MLQDQGLWDLAWVVANAGSSVLVLARVLGLCLTAPVLAVPQLDWRFRLLLGGSLAAVLAPLLATRNSVAPAFFPSISGGLSAVIAEVLAGGLLGATAGLIVAGARLGGELVASQAGFSAGALFDPDSGEESTPLGRFYGLLAIAVFLALDGPLMLIQSLVESYQTIPMGQLLPTGELASQIFGRVGRALELALRAAAPAAVALTLAGIAVGWLSRAAPSLPFVTLAMPLRAVLGIIVVLLGMAALVTTLSTAWGTFPGSF
jgi:flagellar biosynthesis protein FliR